MGVFEEALMNSVVRTLMTFLLGLDNVLSSSTSFIKGPGKNSLPMHSDNLFQAGTQMMPSNANAAFLLSDYDGLEGGAICFVPGSHRIGVGPWKPEHVDPHKCGAVPVVAKAGSLAVWHGNTWHGAYNKTSLGLRVNLTLFHCQPAVVTQERYRETVTQEMLARNSEDFAVVMGQKNHWGFQSEGPSHEPGVAATLDRKRGLRPQVQAENRFGDQGTLGY